MGGELQRGTITVLFSDIVGSTALNTPRGDASSSLTCGDLDVNDEESYKARQRRIENAHPAITSE
jgi:hypothetical protein